jgi:hypothetical protein
MSTTRPLPPPIIPTVNSTGISSNTETTVIGSDNVTFQSTTANFYSNILDINTNEVGPGVTASPPVGGLSVNRGPSIATARIIWSEDDQTWLAGLSTGLRKVALVDLGSQPVGKYLKWDGTKFTSTDTQLVNEIDQSVKQGASPSFNDISLGGAIKVNNNTTSYYLPLLDGAPNRVLATDGSGNLSWVNPLIGGAVATIEDATTGQTNINAYVNLLDYRALSTQIATMTQTKTTILNELAMSGKVTFTPIYVSSNTYSIPQGACMIIYNGTGNSTFTMPSAASNPGRLIIIKNITLNNVIINLSGSDTFDGTPSAIQLSDINDSILSFSDGVSDWILV